eukprot:12645672-Alexandrium_andersonii.AAC.1
MTAWNPPLPHLTQARASTAWHRGRARVSSFFGGGVARPSCAIATRSSAPGPGSSWAPSLLTSFTRASWASCRSTACT